MRQLRSIVFGAAGIRLAAALGIVACLTAFVATAGPREIAATRAKATRAALAQLSPQQRTIEVAAGWFPEAGHPGSILTPRAERDFNAALAARFGPGVGSSSADWQLFAAGQLLRLPSAAPSAITAPYRAQLPELQVSYDSGLRQDATLVAGNWPGAATTGVPGGSAADSGALVLQVVMTQANAARFSLHPGSLQALGAAGSRPVWLRVTGIVRPKPGALFWSSADVQPAPYRNGPSSAQYWVGGVVVGRPELSAMQQAQPATNLSGNWYFPVATGNLQPQQLGHLAAAIDALTSSNVTATAARIAGFSFDGQPSVSSALPAALSAIASQLAATGGIDALVVDGLFISGLLLTLLCAGLAAGFYEPEFALTRARGGSLRQIALRALARACGTAGPGLAAGIVAGLVAVPATGTGTWGWLLPAGTVVLTIGAVPVRCTWRVRRGDSARSARRSDLTVRQDSSRRLVAEFTVLAVALAAVVVLRVRGYSGTDVLAVASPVLVAVAASILVARLYPLPVRTLLPLAARRPGPVSFLGLASAARSRLSSVVPALVLVLTLTLAAFGWMLAVSVSAGQAAASWAATGADAVVTAAGNNVIRPSAQRAFAAVPGVRHTALVYTTTSSTVFAPSLISPAGRSVAVGLAVVSPGQYAALAAGTPWPRFPAAALAKHGGNVPVLISAGAAADPSVTARTGTRQVLELDGIRLPVVVAGGIGQTPAFPAGGNYVVLPAWAEARFPSITGPSTLLLTGPAARPAALAAVASREVPGGQYVFRADLLRADHRSAAEYAVRLIIASTWAAAVLSAAALLFGLAATAPARRLIRSRMAGLGMERGQARTLVLFDPVPLLAIAVVGTVASAAALSLISRQVINLAAVTGSASPAPVSLNAAAMIVPVASAVVLGLLAVAAENALAGRGDTATALRLEEAG